MTTEQYENELAELLQRKAQNKKEGVELDEALTNLRFRRDNPTFEELLNGQILIESPIEDIQCAFVKRD